MTDVLHGTDDAIMPQATSIPSRACPHRRAVQRVRYRDLDVAGPGPVGELPRSRAMQRTGWPARRAVRGPAARRCTQMPRQQDSATALVRASAALRERFDQVAVPRRSQRLALREERPDTAVTAESARWSSFALRADGSWRSAATARRWTSSRASGSAMASSSQVRSRADRKTHILSVPSSSRLETNPADWRTPCRIELCIRGVAGSQVGAQPGMSTVFAALPAARRANQLRRRGWSSRAAGDKRDIRMPAPAATAASGRLRRVGGRGRRAHDHLRSPGVGLLCRVAVLRARLRPRCQGADGQYHPPPVRGPQAGDRLVAQLHLERRAAGRPIRVK